MTKNIFMVMVLITILFTACGIAASTSTGTDLPEADLRITRENLVGVWELEDAVNRQKNELANRLEFFIDGTSIIDNIQVAWQLRDGNRMQTIVSADIGSIFDIELSENGTLLIYHYDGLDYSGERPRKGIYRKD
jgi:hypothetical protein